MKQHRPKDAAARPGPGPRQILGLVMALALGPLAVGSPVRAQVPVPAPGQAPPPAMALADPGFLRSEAAVFGSPLGARWRDLAPPSTDFDAGQGEIGAGTGGRPVDDDRTGPSDLGVKFKAGALSAVLPGAGQFYNGDRQKAYLMGGVEVAIWTAYFVFDTQGDNRMDTAKEFAGIYAGVGGEHPDFYWQNVGRFMDSDAYNDARRREARALQEEPSGLISDADAWQWVNDDRLDAYRTLRADGNSAYDRRDFMILFAVVNRAVAVVDAVMGAGADEPGLHTGVLGLDLQVAMEPSLARPGARWALAGRF